jgi:hypothetical protein
MGSILYFLRVQPVEFFELEGIPGVMDTSPVSIRGAGEMTGHWLTASI